MNLFNDSILYSEKYGHTFEDLISYIEDSEKLKCTYDNKLNDSEALKYVLCDNVPDSVLKRKRIMDVENSYTQKYIRLALQDIDDKDVRLSVIQSLNISKIEKSLKYVYMKNLSKGQKSRVRILCKLIWYNIYTERI